MIGVIVTLVVVGVILYLVETIIPMDPTVKLVLRVVILLLLCLYLLNVFGIVDVPIPRAR